MVVPNPRFNPESRTAALDLAAELGARREAAREQPFEFSGAVTPAFADDLIRSIRSDRDGA